MSNNHKGNVQPAIDQEEHSHISGVPGKKVFVIDSQGNVVDFGGAVTSYEGGVVTVGTSAVELTFTGTTQVISIKSASTNTGLIWFGGSNIDNTGANAIGELTADSAVEIELNDASVPIYVCSDTATQKVYKMALV